MSECECLSTCPFFNDQMATMPHLAEVYKKRYCKGDFLACARFTIFKALGREAVPGDLLPNESERLDRLMQVLVPATPSP